MSQGIYWILTIPQHDYLPFRPPGVKFIRGQLESGNTTGFKHWQLLVAFDKKCRLAVVKRTFGDTCHAELTRSSAADDYVWKDETSIEGTRFELGTRAIRRDKSSDWDIVRQNAKAGLFDDIPADIYVRYYNSLKRIRSDHLKPIGIERTVICYWGRSGTGKSRTAWDEAGLEAYPKDPRSKFWDGYMGQEHVVIDEFRGGIDISHMLRWLDRYPVIVEVKGSSTILKASKIWITSNLDPYYWYPELDPLTKDALLRRITVTHFE